MTEHCTFLKKRSNCRNFRFLYSVISISNKAMVTTRSVLRETQPAKQRAKGDAGCARNFLKGEFPKGGIQVPKRGRIVIQLSISSILRDTQGND
ncbi:unnamed protein product [Prunus brigantina]